MSKRQFSDFSTGINGQEDLEAVSQIVRHAEELLQAAQALKQDIQAGKHCGQEDVDHLKSITTEISSTLTKVNRDSAPSHNKAIKLETSETGYPQNMGATPLTPWTSDDRVEPHQPSLPAIHNATLEQMVFTHAGLVKDPILSYERLEWIGDAYLYLMASAFIYQTFPSLGAGRSSQYRELLVRNKTLARYTQSYQLDKRLKLPPEFLQQNSASIATDKQYRKVLGDLFEAYIAGVILGDPEHGLRCASAWMKTLWRDELKEELKREFRERPVRSADGHLWIPKTNGAVPASAAASEPTVASLPTAAQTTTQLSPKVRLAQAIGGRGIVIEYKDRGQPGKEKKTGLPWYTVAVHLTGWGVRDFYLGHGSALSKKEAGAKAAQAALENKKALVRFEQKKREFDAAMKAQQAYTEMRT